ncbi:MAG: acyl carrier protein [Deltaproteobacteria bacterium]|nr:MAG: acyl carrier protein [Deltaproteobacteria bacterium]
MNEADIMQRLRATLVDEFDAPVEAVVADAHLRADLGFDSLTLTDLAFLVQGDFGFKATAEDFRDVRTVGDLAALIARHVS